MPQWLRVVFLVLVVWAVLSVVLGLLKLVVKVAILLALPVAVLVGYLAWKRGL